MIKVQKYSAFMLMEVKPPKRQNIINIKSWFRIKQIQDIWNLISKDNLK